MTDLDLRLEGKTLPSPSMRRAIREEAGLTQGELAQLLGVARNTVSRWEQGLHEPRAGHRRAYAGALRRMSDWTEQ